MKKTNSLFCLLLALSFIASAQDTAYLDIGNVKALVNSNGTLFQNLTTSNPSFEVPKGSGSFTIYSSSLWLSSESTRNGQRHVAVSHERFGHDSLFNKGPVDIVNQQADASPQFQRLWKINQSEIDAHIQNWNSPGYVTPNSILEWPGNGNANTAQNLAPYMDLDSDNTYEPLDGEYPIIKGDQAIFLMLNDYRPDEIVELQQMPPNPPLFLYNTGGLKVEIHLMLYAFDSPIPAIANTIFTHLTVHHRSNSTIDNHSDFHCSVYADFDVGSPSDDYVGTHLSRDLFYAYNGSLFDSNHGGVNGYGHRLAAQGIKFLDYDIQHSLYHNIGSATNGDPTLPDQFAGYQKGRWKNGQSFYFGGNGFDYCIDTTEATKFVYSGDPTQINDTSEWVESNPCLSSSSTPNAVGDRRMIGGPNVPQQFNIGESFELNYAYIFAQDDDTSFHISEPVSKLFSTADSVQHFFDNNITTGIATASSDPIKFNVHPNPARQKVSLEVPTSSFEVSVFDISGALVENVSNVSSLDVSHYAEGVYFLQLKTAHQIVTQKLIVSD